MNEMNAAAARSLGDSTSYAVFSTEVDSSLLNFMPRAAARGDWGITGDEFGGFDIWHCYEATFLTDNGLPIAGTLKLVFPVTNPQVVESKSLKLYLNTFDMTKMGAGKEAASEAYVARVTKDLREAGLEVEASFFDEESMHFTAGRLPSSPPPLAQFALMSKDIGDAEITDYTGAGNYIAARVPYDEFPETHLVCTNILRSRCRHTKQKDSGSAFFGLTGQSIDTTGVMRQVIALREVNEFHEFCAEKLFVELTKGYDSVVVILVYARRGGIDINPIRYSPGGVVKRLADVVSDLIDPAILNPPAFGQ